MAPMETKEMRPEPALPTKEGLAKLRPVPALPKAPGAGKSAAAGDDAKPKTLYEKEELQGRHFSSLLLSGDVTNTAIEWGIRLGLILLGLANPGGVFTPVAGSQSLAEVGLWMAAMSAFLRFYNTFLEYCYFKRPEYRTQPPLEHRLRDKVDLVGRELKDLRAQQLHDRGTIILDGILAVAVYVLVPGFYPGADGPSHGWLERVVRLIAHQYVLSFSMYWAHRAGHVVPWKWANVHGVHHQATHPLSRVTYQAHFIDNFMNAIYGHTFAQCLVPLDHFSYYFIHFLRIAESLEKHSGISCHLNFAHNLQKWLPFSQMPHHHDLHHEGSKRCNFTFSAAGGLWDWAFGSRKAGRAPELGTQATVLDHKLAEEERKRAEINPSSSGNTIGAVPMGKITVDELKEHAEPAKAWIVVGGSVYDVAKYASKHPGGEKLIHDLAGKDATKAFEDVGHSNKAHVILRSLRIGDLAGAQVTGPKTDDASFWNGHIAVHLPLWLSISLVAFFGPPGAAYLAGFAATVLAGEMAVCHYHS